jgi:rhomboid family GlyGly-CTERM serine protease
LTPLLAKTSRAWIALSATLALAALAGWFVPREWLDWQPRLAATQPWRLWTAAWVHWSAMHLLANLAGCAVVATFGAAARMQRHSVYAWLAAWPLTHAALAAQPRLLHYGGLSGVLHAGVAVVAWQLVAHDRGPRRAIGGAVLAGLALKLALEQPWLGPTRLVAGWDMAIAPLAHLSGTLSGLLCSAASQVLIGRHQRVLP